MPVARWLANEVADLLVSNSLTSDLFTQCSSNPSPRLSPAQEQLVGVICRLPDLLANRLGRSLQATLLPAEYFRLVGGAVYNCLERVYTGIKGAICIGNHTHSSPIWEIIVLAILKIVRGEAKYNF